MMKYWPRPGLLWSRSGAQDWMAHELTRIVHKLGGQLGLALTTTTSVALIYHALISAQSVTNIEIIFDAVLKL